MHFTTELIKKTSNFKKKNHYSCILSHKSVKLWSYNRGFSPNQDWTCEGQKSWKTSPTCLEFHHELLSWGWQSLTKIYSIFSTRDQTFLHAIKQVNPLRSRKGGGGLTGNILRHSQNPFRGFLCIEKLKSIKRSLSLVIGFFSLFNRHSCCFLDKFLSCRPTAFLDLCSGLDVSCREGIPIHTRDGVLFLFSSAGFLIDLDRLLSYSTSYCHIHHSVSV